VARRPVAVIAAVVLLCEAVGIVLAHLFLGLVVDEQRMSLGGVDPDAMRTGAIAGGVLLGTFLLLCAVVLLAAAVRDRAPGRFGRVLLIAAAVLHGLLGALTVGLIGWPAFAFLMAVLALLVWSLVAWSAPPAPSPGDPGRKAPAAA
jgi:hypothetical protein